MYRYLAFLLVSSCAFTGEANAQETPAPSPSLNAVSHTASVIVDSCNQIPSDDGYGVALSFRNMSDSPASAVAFHILFRNSVGELLSQEEGTVEGVFSPGTEIKPRRYVAHPGVTMFHDADSRSPAWEFSLISPDATSITCLPSIIKFADGRAVRLAAKYAD